MEVYWKNQKTTQHKEVRKEVGTLTLMARNLTSDVFDYGPDERKVGGCKQNAESVEKSSTPSPQPHSTFPRGARAAGSYVRRSTLHRQAPPSRCSTGLAQRRLV